MGIFDFLFYNFKPRKGVWYRNKRKVTFIEQPPQMQGQIPVIIGKEVKLGNCYIIRDGKKRRGSFKVMGSKVRFIEGWKYRKERVRIVDTKDCVFSRSSGISSRTYKMKIKNSENVRQEKVSHKTRIRKKGVAIVDTKKGILLVKGNGSTYGLPGGGTNKGESREKATLRELREETGLKGSSAKFLFEYEGSTWHDHKGRKVNNSAKVFLVNAKGTPRPRKEIKKIGFYKTGSKLKVSRGTKKLIEKYYKNK